MNSVLRNTISAICTNTEGWEAPGSGTVLRPQVVVIDSSGKVIKEWFKAKRWCQTSVLPQRQNPWSDHLTKATAKALGYTIETVDPYHNLEQKIADLYSEIRDYLFCWMTPSQLRKDMTLNTVITFIQRLYRELSALHITDFPNGESASAWHLELDMRRSAGDRLAIVFASSKEVANGDV